MKQKKLSFDVHSHRSYIGSPDLIFKLKNLTFPLHACFTIYSIYDCFKVLIHDHFCAEYNCAGKADLSTGY